MCSIALGKFFRVQIGMDFSGGSWGRRVREGGTEREERREEGGRREGGGRREEGGREEGEKDKREGGKR